MTAIQWTATSPKLLDSIPPREGHGRLFCCPFGRRANGWVPNSPASRPGTRSARHPWALRLEPIFTTGLKFEPTRIQPGVRGPHRCGNCVIRTSPPTMVARNRFGGDRDARLENHRGHATDSSHSDTRSTSDTRSVFKFTSSHCERFQIKSVGVADSFPSVALGRAFVPSGPRRRFRRNSFLAWAEMTRVNCVTSAPRPESSEGREDVLRPITLEARIQGTSKMAIAASRRGAAELVRVVVAPDAAPNRPGIHRASESTGFNCVDKSATLGKFARPSHCKSANSLRLGWRFLLPTQNPASRLVTNFDKRFETVPAPKLRTERQRVASSRDSICPIGRSAIGYRGTAMSLRFAIGDHDQNRHRGRGR